MISVKLFRDQRLYMIFSVTLMAVMGVVSLTPAFPGVIAHFGIGHGLILLCVQNKLVSHAPFQERAAFISDNSVLTHTGQTLGPLFAGIFYTLGGLTGVYISGAIAVAVMAVITIFLGRTEKIRSRNSMIPIFQYSKTICQPAVGSCQECVL